MSNTNQRISQRDMVLATLNDKGFITSWDAFTEWGITRLSAVIYRLRHDDKLNIQSERIHKKNRFGYTTNFSKYTIIEEE